MSDMRQSVEAEIDYLAFLETLWNAKWTIVVISVFASLFGLALSLAQPTVYKFSTPISKASDSALIEFFPLNASKKELSDMVTADPKGAVFAGSIIDGAYVFDTFVSQFYNHKEMFSEIEGTAGATDGKYGLLAGLGQDGFLNLASKFKIVAPPKPDGKWVAVFEWRDEQEGKEIIGQLISTALEATKKQIIAETTELSDQLKKVNTAKLKELNVRLELLLDQAQTVNERRIVYLRTQSAIAKELGMANDQLAPNSAAGVQYLVLAEQPFYLRGYKAIDKEIELIELESEKDMLISQKEYDEIAVEIGKIESDITIGQIEDLVSTLKNKDVDNWVLVNTSGGTITSNWNPMLSLILSSFLGLLIAVLFAIGSKEVKKWKFEREQNAKAVAV